jgi:ubiquitin-conjugating enzyme E2 O
VSIQGLVLVKEPWFCEPAYEKLRGTEEGIVNSRLYSEKAYVLSRGFVRRALEIPLGSIGSEIHWMYFTNKRLEKVVRDAETLIDKSRSPAISDADHDLAVPRLSGGGIITLERTLGKLRNILDSHTGDRISY